MMASRKVSSPSHTPKEHEGAGFAQSTPRHTGEDVRVSLVYLNIDPGTRVMLVFDIFKRVATWRSSLHLRDGREARNRRRESSNRSLATSSKRSSLLRISISSCHGWRRPVPGRCAACKPFLKPCSVENITVTHTRKKKTQMAERHVYVCVILKHTSTCCARAFSPRIA